MIGLVVVTHGNLAVEFIAAMEHIVGPQTALEPVCIAPEADDGESRSAITAAIARVDGGRGVILLTDLFGGTPSNLAISFLEDGKVEVLAGINLPMLVRLAGARKNMNIANAVAAASETGKKYIVVASAYLKEMT